MLGAADLTLLLMTKSDGLTPAEMIREEINGEVTTELLDVRSLGWAAVIELLVDLQRSLTAQQWRVFTLRVLGYYQADIGVMLGIERTTVETHLDRIKLKIKELTEPGRVR